MQITGQALVNGALTALGMLEQGGTPSVSDSNDTLNELNIAWDAWSIDESKIWAVIAQRFPWAASIAFQTVGPGAQFNTQLPSRIYNARWVTVTGGAISSSQIDQAGLGYAANDTGTIPTGSGTVATYTVNTVDANGAVLTATLSAGTGYQPGYGYGTRTGGAQPGAGTGLTFDVLTVTTPGSHRIPVSVVSSDDYYSHRDLNASATVPDEVYPDFNPDASGFAKVYAFPVPNAAGTLELDTAVAFLVWTLTDAYNLPPGAQDDLQYALAWRLLPRFGAAVNQQIAEVIRELGQKAEARFVAANSINRQRPQQSAAPGPQQSPISTPGVNAFQGLQPKS